MTALDLNGFDPLSENTQELQGDRSVFEEATRRVVQNILKSYTGYFDIFSELIQNSLDALDKRAKKDPKFSPNLKIKIDISKKIVRICDNGCGMSPEQLMYCFRPNVSFKSKRESRGHKGVGSTFLAYGFGTIQIATKRNDQSIAVKLENGRLWAEDESGSYSRPALGVVDFFANELNSELSGTCTEIRILDGQRPDLGWWSASTATQWYEMLRMKTPLGGVYLSGREAPRVKVDIAVIDYANTETEETFEEVDYPYPHQLSSVLPRVKSYAEIRNAIARTEGNNSEIPEEFKRIDAMWGVWNFEQLVDEEGPFASQKFDESEEALIRKHKVSVYGCFLSSAKQWGQYQRETLKIRRDPLLLKGGLMIASDHMTQGDLMVIPLTSTIGYQANTHVVVHFHDGNPDMGRKVFQPELKKLADDLSRQVVNIFKRYLFLMREDTGAANVANQSDTYEWLTEKSEYRRNHPLEARIGENIIPYTCNPRAEQDVVALFHELVGMSYFKGIRFLSTSEQDKYDSCYTLHYNSVDPFGYHSKNRPLGVDPNLIREKESKPFILEYKYSLDGLIADFAKELKFQNEIDLVVCWDVGKAYKERFILNSYLVGEEGVGRQVYGATHSIWHEKQKLADIICLSDIVKLIQDPKSIIAEHETLYK